MSLRYLTAGETHGPQLTAIIEGLPSNLQLDFEELNFQLHRRQKGHGRGRRMQIEKDTANIVGGVRHGKTTGAPVALVVENNDWKHWTSVMNIEPIEGSDEEKRRVHRPRPGHADLNGGLKYNLKDLRNVLERSSARETAARVAVGAVARQFLAAFGIKVGGQVIRIGEIEAPANDLPLDELIALTEESPVRVVDKETEAKMTAYIDQIKAEGDSIGGIVECIVEGVPIGLGSHVQYDRKLDGRIAQAVVSINAFKGVEIGIGFEAGTIRGSQVHDEIMYDEERGYHRATNRLGGLRRRHDERRANRRARRHETDPDAVQAAAKRGYRYEGTVHGASRAFRQLRGAGGERRHGACRRLGSGEGVPREVRRRFHGRDSRELQ